VFFISISVSRELLIGISGQVDVSDKVFRRQMEVTGRIRKRWKCQSNWGV